jgi:hypothetical protein
MSKKGKKKPSKDIYDKISDILELVLIKKARLFYIKLFEKVVLKNNLALMSKSVDFPMYLDKNYLESFFPKRFSAFTTFRK